MIATAVRRLNNLARSQNKGRIGTSLERELYQTLHKLKFLVIWTNVPQNVVQQITSYHN